MAGPFLLSGRKTAFPVRIMQSERLFLFLLFRGGHVPPVVPHALHIVVFFLDVIAKNSYIRALFILFFRILP